MIDPVEERHGVLVSAARASQSHADLRTFREACLPFINDDCAWSWCPTLIEERQAAGSEVRNPYRLDRVRSEREHTSNAAHRKELIVDHVEKITRRESIGRRHAVGLAPPDELFAGINRQRSTTEGRREPPDRDGRPQDAAI